jgi:hypothetical protein
MVSTVAWCSPSGTMMRRRSGVTRAHHRPLTPRFTASVPPPVKVTSTESAPTEAATRSRASSSMRLAFCPCVWIDAGLPTTASASAYAAMTSGGIGEVAAWSR